MAVFPLDKVEANPFRHIERYPIRRAKVEALKASFKTTGFWGNIVARQVNGVAQIAYGHHRLRALVEHYADDPRTEVELIIRDLDDEAMLQIMARENMEEWGTSASVEHETIRAVVEAYAQGKIQLPQPDERTHVRAIRDAPSFIPTDAVGAHRQHPYTAQTLANFLGWIAPNGRPQNKVHNALAALEFIEEEILRESDFTGLTTKQAEAVVEQARKVKADREASARIAAQQAERARQQAKLAEQQRKEAEQRRRQREAEAAAARSRAERQRAEQAARQAEEERRQAEQVRRAAERQRVAQEQQERNQREKAREQASKVGKAVSGELQKGRIGYREASQVRQQVAEKSPGPPRDLNDIARRLTSDLDRILAPGRDDMRVGKLNAMIEFKDSLQPTTRSDLVTILNRLADRAATFANQLAEAEQNNSAPSDRSLPEGRTQ